jgi:hypothetical protein
MFLEIYTIRKRYKMEINFCEGWFRAHKTITGLMSFEKAKKLDLKGKPYTVIVGNQNNPYCFIEIGFGNYGVNFLDTLKRVYLSYGFLKKENGMLFLSEVINKEFDGNTDNISSKEIYWFKPDGKFTYGIAHPPFEKIELKEKIVDVNKNWEKKPEFGKYDSLLKINR